MKPSFRTAIVVPLLWIATVASADPLTCNLADYRPVPGLAAAAATDALTITWDGDAAQQVRLRMTVMSGVPTIAELAVRPQRGDWRVVAAGLTPDYRVVSGVRRVTEQQLQPLRGLKVELTREIIDSIKWDAFWDAPLNTEPLENTRM